MTITETLRGAWRRMAGVSAVGLSDTQLAKQRRTSALPSIFNSYGPIAEAMPKPTPYNLRRFSETPVARRAINCIKDRIAGMRWRVQPRQGYSVEAIPYGAERVRMLTSNFESPNPEDSFRSFAEQVLEDVIVGGYGAIEVQMGPRWDSESAHLLAEAGGTSLRSSRTGEAPVPTQPLFTHALPLVMWPVDGASIRMNLEWDGALDSPR